MRTPDFSAGASMAQVEQRLGKPVDVAAAPDGDTVWQYPRGPYGQQTYVVRFGKDQRVRSVTQALTWEHFATIREGMTRDEIRLAFGRPGQTVFYRNLNEEVWSYRYVIPASHNRIFNVHFDAATGRVRTTSDQEDPLFIPPIRYVG
jgi:hypothetical protein